MKGRDILGGLPNRTKAATSAYRDGWSGVFGRTDAGKRMRADLDAARSAADVECGCPTCDPYRWGEELKCACPSCCGIVEEANADCRRRHPPDDETPEQHIARLRAMWP